MFLETTVFGREFFYVQELYKKGELGKLQYMTCARYQDMEGGKKMPIPEFWEIWRAEKWLKEKKCTVKQ